MAERIDATTWHVQGRVLRTPIRIDQARAAAAVFAVPVEPVRRMLAGSGLVPVSVAGRTLASVMLVAYADAPGNDLGGYDELALAFLVRGPDGRLGSHVRQLPVSQDFTREAGVALWGFPKWLATFALTLGEDAATCVLSSDGRTVAEVSLRTWRWPALPSLSQSASLITLQDGRPSVCRPSLRLRGLRLRLGGGAQVVPGEGHALADELRELGLPRRALLTVIASHVEAGFPPAEAITPRR